MRLFRKREYRVVMFEPDEVADSSAAAPRPETRDVPDDAWSRSWAWQLATEVVSKFESNGEVGSWAQLLGISAPRDDVVEVRFLILGDPMVYGIRLVRRDCELGASLCGILPIPDLAWYVIQLGIEEPRDPRDFEAPDADGVRWLPWEQWAC